MPLLQSRNIAVHRAGSPPLYFPDLAIDKNESALLLGPSGCGKTTLLCVLAGLLKPTTGEVNFEGRDFYKASAHERDRIRGRNFGFVFQTLHLLPSLTMRQNVALAANMAGLKANDARMDFLLVELGVSTKSHRRPRALSQGEQQRAAIARAVLNRPQIIIADEPTSALDDTNAQVVMDLLEKQAAESGAALLIATHDNRIISRFKNIIHLDRQIKEAA